MAGTGIGAVAFSLLKPLSKPSANSCRQEALTDKFASPHSDCPCFTHRICCYEQSTLSFVRIVVQLGSMKKFRQSWDAVLVGERKAKFDRASLDKQREADSVA